MFTLSLKQFGIEISLDYSHYHHREHRRFYHYEAKLNGSVLFSGNDFSPSPMDHNSPINMLVSCLSFHCLQPGDTDSEYFDKYTPEQMQWANSFECEQLKGLISDFEDKHSEYYQNAYQTFLAGFKEPVS